VIERRLKHRYPIALVGSYRSPLWMADGEAINISSGGLLFRTYDSPPVPPGGLVKVDLDWPALLNGRNLFMRCQGRVIWSAENRIGVELRGYEFRVRGSL
jgi:hypothetical protein